MLVGEVGVVDGGGAGVLDDEPLMYELYEDECAVLRSTPKKPKKSCSWKLELMSAGSSTPVVEEATYARTAVPFRFPLPNEPPSQTVQFYSKRWSVN